jgi:hypothetical protein
MVLADTLVSDEPPRLACLYETLGHATPINCCSGKTYGFRSRSQIRHQSMMDVRPSVADTHVTAITRKGLDVKTGPGVASAPAGRHAGAGSGGDGAGPSGAVFNLVAETFPRETGTVTGLVGAAGGLGGFFPPILMGLVRDATGAYSIGFMLLS